MSSKPAQSIQFPSFGHPKDVLTLKPMTGSSTLKVGEIRVDIQYSPINPADINYIQGTYGVRPELPAIPGVEASGIVIETQSPDVKVGDHVIFLERVGTWQSQVICDASSIYRVPSELNLPHEQASMLKVNPLTALRLLEGFVDLTAGDYIIQNAANSGVGQCVIQIAKLLGIKTINIVRREELIQPLLNLGADHVFLDNPELLPAVEKICATTPPKLACNAVGGDSATRLMDAIAPQATHVTYGAMSLRSLKVPNKFLIFKRISIQGLWVTEWLQNSTKSEINAAYTKLAEWISQGKLDQPIDTIYPAEQIHQATEHAMQDKRNGKILIQFSNLASPLQNS